MKTFAAWIIGLAFLGGAGFWGLKEYRAVTGKQAYYLSLAELRAEHETAMQGMSLLSSDAYKQEIGIALTRYFTKLAELDQKYPGMQQFDREVIATNQLKADGKITEEQIAARNEVIELTQKIMKAMREGAYRPIYTSADHPFRLDILAIEPATIDGNQRIKVSFVQWGGGDKVQNRHIVGNFQGVINAKGKKQGLQMTADNQPPTVIVKPERWVAEFPPNARIGYYDLPLFPPNANSLDLGLEFALTTPGGTELPIKVNFPSIPMEAGWKLTEGQWAQNQRIGTPEEIH